MLTAKERFYKKFKKKDIISIIILMEELNISRPTATKLMQQLWSDDTIEPIWSRTIDKCYQVN